MSSPAGALRSRMPRFVPWVDGAAVERARLRVVPRRRTRAARVPFVALVSLVLLGGVIGLLLFNTSMQQAAFATTALEEQATTLTARQQTLEMELDVLRNPQRVAEEAQRLGMVPAGTPAYLTMPGGKVLGQPSPATTENQIRIEPMPPAKPAVLTPDPVVRRIVALGPPSSSLGSDRDRQAGSDQRADRRPAPRSGD